MTISDSSSDGLAILSRLLFSDAANAHSEFPINREQFDAALSLANTHHVVMRTMETFRGIATAAKDDQRCEWATQALAQERARIERAIAFLPQICGMLAAEGCEVAVIKSLDHWPDLGSDLDLYSSAEPTTVIRAMTHRLNAQVAARSWGDRLANKWNFIVPGLPELVEIHVERLGQTGELGNFASSLIPRSRLISISSDRRLFRVPAATDRLMICTLQRMYRHFYIRLCDIADTARLLETEEIDFDDLRHSAQKSGIWEGIATFLTIVSEYVAQWRGRGVALPESVLSAAQFGADQITFANGFLRVPLLPHAVRLYASEWTSLMLNGEVRSTARLSLLPWLATAAAVGLKITGSDKGIW
jgi:hypothetical protein